MDNWLASFREGVTALALTVTAEQEDRFARFLKLLLDYNQRVNLTSITDPAEVAVKHFVDSLTVESIWQPHAGDRALDIGTGAGLPGIPLAILHPEITMVLNESVRKKVEFLEYAVAQLSLTNAHPVWARAEDLGRQPEYREQFNAVFVRAVAHLAVLVEYGLPLLKMGGVLICMKGPGGMHEIDESQRALNVIGGVITKVSPLTVQGAGERVLIVVRKNHRTSQEFPRPVGTAKKTPLFLDSTGAKT